MTVISTIELKYGIDRINRPYSKCTDFRFSEFTTIDDKDLNYHWEELSLKKTILSFI